MDNNESCSETAGLTRREFKMAALALLAILPRRQLRFRPAEPRHGCLLQRVLGRNYGGPLRALFGACDDPWIALHLVEYVDVYAEPGTWYPEAAKEHLIATIESLPD